MAKEKKYKIPATVKYVFEATPEKSKQMSRVKNKNTVPELLLRKALWHSGIRYRLNVSKLPGKPDLVIEKRKLVIFVDGDFWHGYEWEIRKLKMKKNLDYWIPKIEENMKRDIINTEKLNTMGYTVLRIWEHEIKKDVNTCVLRVLAECSTTQGATDYK